MRENSIQERLKLAESAAVRGGTRMLALAESPGTVEMKWKEDRSMVLSLDLASNAEIMASLADHQLVSEEDPSTHRLLESTDPYFVIDPLDGTHSCRRMLKNHGKFIEGQIGFGPMIGIVENRRLKAATFLSLTEKKLFSAIVGGGAYECDWIPENSLLSLSSRTKLSVAEPAPLGESAVLYYPGLKGEMDLVKTLKETGIVENVYRFGGFANDCTRLARGYEQIHVQLSLKAWDLPAALIATEAGLEAVMDPNGRKISLAQWDVVETNPLLMVHRKLKAELIKRLYGE